MDWLAASGRNSSARERHATEKSTLAICMTKSIAPPPPTLALLSNHRLPVTTMLCRSVFARSVVPSRLHVESVMREHVSKRRVSNLISELGKVHGLIGNPIERRSSLNVALTSSGDGQSEDGSFVFLAGGGGAARGGSSGVKPSLA